MRAAWQAEYLDADGRLTPDTQANHVRALAFDLVPTELRPAVADRLVELIREGRHPPGHRLPRPRRTCCRCSPTPAISTSPTSCCCRTREPSWLVMVDRGATTVWERWNGVSADGVPHESLNHYSKGAVISFLHRYTAGIELLTSPPTGDSGSGRDPAGGLTLGRGGARVAVRPDRVGVADRRRRLRRCASSSPRARTAEVVLPDGRTSTAGPGEHTYTCTVVSLVSI